MAWGKRYGWIFPGRRRAPILSCLVFLLAGPAGAAPEPFDILIAGGTVYSGDAAPDMAAGRRADVGIVGDKIVFVGDGAGHAAKRRIDASGLVVSPGFIDAHSHFEMTQLLADDPAVRASPANLAQGVTGHVVGVDGEGGLDVAGFYAKARRLGVGQNIATYVGLRAVRRAVLGTAHIAPDAAQLAAMQKLVRGAMCEGAIGFSTGLFYDMQGYASTEEVIALARQAGVLGGVYDSHIRSEAEADPAGYGFVRAVEELIRIAREAKIPGHIGHLKASGRSSGGKADTVISLVERARAEGVEVTADQYAFLAHGGSVGRQIIPGWVTRDGRKVALERLADPALQGRIRSEIGGFLTEVTGRELFISPDAPSPYRGKTLADIARAWKLNETDAAIRLYREGDPGMNTFGVQAEDFRRFMVQPWVATSSDGGWPGDSHPRNAAAFATLYRSFVHDEPLLSMEEFVRRSSSATADAARLPGRGYLKPGYFADIAIFDPEDFRPQATYFHPALLARGMRFTLVNGVVAFEDGRPTGDLAGRPMIKPVPPGCAGAL